VPAPITCKLPIPRSSPSAVGNSRTQSFNLFAVTFRNSLPYESGFGSNAYTLAPCCLKERKHPDIRANVENGPAALRDEIGVPIVLEPPIYFVEDEDLGGPYSNDICRTRKRTVVSHRCVLKGISRAV
jgi:hypothetical protein